MTANSESASSRCPLIRLWRVSPDPARAVRTIPRRARRARRPRSAISNASDPEPTAGGTSSAAAKPTGPMYLVCRLLPPPLGAQVSQLSVGRCDDHPLTTTRRLSIGSSSGPRSEPRQGYLQLLAADQPGALKAPNHGDDVVT